MNIERTLQVTIAFLTAFGTLLLGMGSGNVILPLVATFVAVTSLYFTDQLGWIRLNRNVASAAALAAVAISVIDFYQLGRDRQLLAIAYLLIYLQIVLMYQHKDVRVYWQLFMLSLLQVVVASALNFGMLFGALLIAYMFLALFSLSVFFIYREITQLGAVTDQPSDIAAARQPGPAATGLQSGSVMTGDNVRLDGVLADEFRNSTLRNGLWRRIVVDGTLTLLLTVLFFFFLPRSGDRSPIRRITAGRMVGFTDTVKLGSLGTAFQNPQAVMRVWFEEPQSRQPYRLHGEPLFRGTVVNHYEEGTWGLRFKPNTDAQFQGVIRLDQASPGGVKPIYQRISLEPLPESTVCSVYPPYALNKDDPVAYDVAKQQIVRLVPDQFRMDLTVVTKGLQRGVQREIVPVDGEVELVNLQDLLQLPSGTVEHNPLARLTALAERVLQNADVPAGDRIGKAHALERYLRDSGQFNYTLTGQNRDPALDPIEDFVANNPRGHCEYFSSALTLMLRSQGIPARMVIGFKGGEWNSLGSYYQVRQLHAHSWVEAYLDNIPPSQQLEGRVRGVRMPGWLRLDPTPASEAELTPTTTTTLADRVKEWMNYTEFLWSDYVVDLNAKRQQEGIYAPLAELGEIASAFFSKRFWTESLPGGVMSLFNGRAWQWLKANWTNWRGGLSAIFVLLLVLTVHRLVRRLGGRAGRWKLRRRSTVRGQVATVEFYRKLETLLKRQGLIRPPGQTQREFAMAVGGQLVERPSQAPVAGIPKFIVDQYYRVRYGGAKLDQEESDAIETALGRLQGSLKDRP